MTVTHETGSGIHMIRARDRVGPLTFQGETIADLSWSYEEAEERGHQRWTDIALYRVTEEGPYAYVLQTVGRSIVYHKPGLPCQRGVNMRVSRLRENEAHYRALFACTVCNPVELDDVSDSTMVAVEQDIPTLYKCATAHEMVSLLEKRLRGGGMSGVNLKILQTASAADEGIAAAMMEMRGL
jgi:hypothetical protein